ncbi:MAG: hypothetical protein RLY58_1467 [Pseudomonadota bacterium]|jgi:hypothetical protein
MPSIPQPLSTPRAKLGLVTLICLLWHILLPTLVNVGVMPALYALPSHCQPVVQTLLKLSPATAMTPESPIMADMHDMQSPHLMPTDATATATAQADHQAMIDQQVNAKTQAMWQLAAKIMASCPLCSHGLEGAVLPVLAFVLAVLVLLLSPRQQVIFTVWRATFFSACPYLRPHSHGPPFTTLMT